MEYGIVPLLPGLFCLEQRGVRAFLVVGREHALLIDSCFGGDLPAACRRITTLPITLITTHSDFDHIGGHGQFDFHYIHPLEQQRYLRKGGAPIPVRDAPEEMVFTAGDYSLEVVLLSGHTPGSIGLLERRHGFLLAGDAVQQHAIFMHGDGRCLPDFRRSIRKLQQLWESGAFHTIYSSHGPAAVPADILQDHLQLCDALLAGTAQPLGEAPDRFPKSVKTFGWGRVQMYIDPSDIPV